MMAAIYHAYILGLCIIYITSRSVCFGLSPPKANLPISGVSRCPVILYTSKDNDNVSSSTSSSTLYEKLPSKKPWTFGILTSGFPPQQILVPVVKFVTFQVWRLMMNELVTHDEEGRFIRESFQAGNDPSPLDLPVSGNATPKYKLYLGNPCPVSYCYSVIAVMFFCDCSYTLCISVPILYYLLWYSYL